MIPPPLIALTPGDLAPGAEAGLLARLSDAFAAGLPGVLVREPHLSDRTLHGLLAAVLGLRPEGTWVALHDRVHLALALGADAVHLGFRSLAPADARTCSENAAGDAGGGGLPLTIGLSTHAEDDPGSWAPADYLFHGPVRATRPKAGVPPRAPVGLEGLGRAAAASPRPTWALGGIRPEDVAPALAAGARGVAVLSGILPRPDPAEATRAYLAALEAAG